MLANLPTARRSIARDQGEAQGSRVLIFTAGVAQGHLSTARALSTALRSDERVEAVTVADMLALRGGMLRFVLRDVYRWQLSAAPWVFGVGYDWVASRPRLRKFGARALAVVAGRCMERHVLTERPDIIVSTFPAATAVLGFLNRKGRIQAPVVAVITDLGGLEFWTHPNVDLHLVMHEACRSDVEALVRQESVAIVQPVVGSEFFDRTRNGRVRGAFCADRKERLAVVSGGGWGAGDLTSAVKCLLTLPFERIICVTGHNSKARRKLSARFRAERRVSVLGFVDHMPELLLAADVLVHTTAGVTCLEAWTCGCPTVVYGSPPGHAPRANRRMAELGIVSLANSHAELAAAVESALRRPGSPLPGARYPTAASLIVGAARRAE